ncbi:universal stress protein [Catenuloplanes atrovinosus]|uniref:Nucleotide-binding universal stress UspA family protein n=1 Tax=Catenuloplanes atrovinosus TaxID=137266 RepID=A0AAE4C9W4_9ACTN|nr:universal stress protein [Catenuloplanes atrovinosus]MDR7274005.1 nucleotide-binding universal stress UspA family protein [Catenuloplanes atrovinosus]
MSGIVVGVDGSSGAETAVRWAAARSRANGAPVRLVHAYSLPVPYPGSPFVPAAGVAADSGAYAKAAAAVLAEAARIATEAGAASVTTEAVVGGAAGVLIDASDGAGLVVVGSRGLGGFTGLLLGSVGVQVSGHARCPAVVVREPATPGGPVVVGVDGSPPSHAAVLFAFAEAERLGAELIAVHAWGLPAPVDPTLMAFPTERDRDDYATAAGRVLHDALAEGRSRHPSVPVREASVERAASTGLLEIAEHPALIVVGSRGHGGFAGLLLGSTSQYVLHHAHCPVAVLRADVDPEASEA